MNQLPFIFGDQIQQYLQGIGRLVARHEGVRYSFFPDVEYRRLVLSDPVRARGIYWYEILERAHLASVTSLFRAKRWIEGANTAAMDRNLLVTAAALRGLLEAAADTLDALLSVPHALAKNRPQIMNALYGKAESWLVAQDIEDTLIHFLYARRPEKGEDVPASHRAKLASEYNKILLKAQIPHVDQLYSRLCGLTHPAGSSILFMLGLDEEGHSFSSDGETIALERLLDEYRSAIEQLPMLAINPGVLILAVLNYFDIHFLHTPELLNWNLNGIPEWTKCMRHLGDSRPML